MGEWEDLEFRVWGECKKEGGEGDDCELLVFKPQPASTGCLKTRDEAEERGKEERDVKERDKVEAEAEESGQGDTDAEEDAREKEQ